MNSFYVQFIMFKVIALSDAQVDAEKSTPVPVASITHCILYEILYYSHAAHGPCACVACVGLNVKFSQPNYETKERRTKM